MKLAIYTAGNLFLLTFIHNYAPFYPKTICHILIKIRNRTIKNKHKGKNSLIKSFMVAPFYFNKTYFNQSGISEFIIASKIVFDRKRQTASITITIKNGKIATIKFVTHSTNFFIPYSFPPLRTTLKAPS
jgi:hypothetical protein